MQNNHNTALCKIITIPLYAKMTGKKKSRIMVLRVPTSREHVLLQTAEQWQNNG